MEQWPVTRIYRWENSTELPSDKFTVCMKIGIWWNETSADATCSRTIKCRTTSHTTHRSVAVMLQHRTVWNDTSCSDGEWWVCTCIENSLMKLHIRTALKQNSKTMLWQPTAVYRHTASASAPTQKLSKNINWSYPYTLTTRREVHERQQSTTPSPTKNITLYDRCITWSAPVDDKIME